MGSVSEVQLALNARDDLAAQGISARVVSMPSMEWFEAQPAEYKEAVLPKNVKARVSVEAGLALSWYPYLGSDGVAVSIETFGTPGGGKDLFDHYGFTTENVVAAAKESIANVEEQ